MGYTNSLLFDGLLHKHEYSEDSVLKFLSWIFGDVEKRLD